MSGARASGGHKRWRGREGERESEGERASDGERESDGDDASWRDEAPNRLRSWTRRARRRMRAQSRSRIHRPEWKRALSWKLDSLRMGEVKETSAFLLRSAPRRGRPTKPPQSLSTTLRRSLRLTLTHREAFLQRPSHQFPLLQCRQLALARQLEEKLIFLGAPTPGVSSFAALEDDKNSVGGNRSSEGALGSLQHELDLPPPLPQPKLIHQRRRQGPDLGLDLDIVKISGQMIWD